MEKTIQTRVVSPENWLTARQHFLTKEKELTKLRDELSAARRALPWVRVSKQYVFDGPDGETTLADLFGHRSQLIINHFMMAPGWAEGCPGCSFNADHMATAFVHLEHHDVAYVAISRAPFHEIAAFKKRMGWKFRWLSSFRSDFNYDFHVSFTKQELSKGVAWYNFNLQKVDCEELPGTSVFYKDDSGAVFHTYSAYGRGVEECLSTYMHLDFTPKGRNETGPYYNQGDWVRLHDMYSDEPAASSCCHAEKGGGQS